MILDRSYREEVVDRIESLRPSIRDGIFCKSDNVDSLWALYQKNIEDYELTPDEAWRFALEDFMTLKDSAPAEPPPAQPAPAPAPMPEGATQCHLSINVLGTRYGVTVKSYDDDEGFKKSDIGGYCDTTNKEIVICDMTTFDGWEDESRADCEAQQRETLRHEIVHAFLYESGLGPNSNVSPAWATNEEMVDWIAIQGPKIYKAWQNANVL